VQGTGSGGAITREDVQRAAGTKAEAGKGEKREDAADRQVRMRQAIAAAMVI